MSRATIKDLYWEIAQETYANNVWMKYKDIEVVPRKMVEMIIEKCKEIQHDNNNDDDRHECGKWCASDEIKEYAESLLDEFENGKI